MVNNEDWYSFYEPYIEIQNLFNVEAIIEHHIRHNYVDLIVKQYEQYKENGKYSNAGDFIENEIQSGLKNPASYYSELKKGKKKYNDNIFSKIKEFPIFEKIHSALDYVEYDKERNYLKDTLMLGKYFLDHPECAHFLLWIFANTDDDSLKFRFGSHYLWNTSRKILKNIDEFEKYDESYYRISLDNFKKYLNIKEFLTEESVLDLYIKLNYSKILKDEYRNFKEKEPRASQDIFMLHKKLYEGTDDARYLYDALVKGRKKMDNKLIEGFRDLSILKQDSNSPHSKEIEKLNRIRLALQMGALAFDKFPYLTTAEIISAVNRAKSEGHGRLYLKALAEELQRGSDELSREEHDIETTIQNDKGNHDIF
ncbi:hypothetical protein [Streptococcus suis]|uniref:hypothetical protein n=1 Tax=Streptococcus suis TaxID=1307 RepID=UPI000415A580|nr:hypothetical protein [Streptococcus suis]NQH20910.1 hypothetical protein [Streptococcus suis]CYV00062.1 Uncharacterised protein [Streptococcus suis]HEM2798990.1 hypothetical protein [Streptococcus suis]HEM3209010.1 hypothetical protein [Streptococcus suis 22083]HEM3936626.1 hypothetical protein [Streptococcus suis]